MGCIARSPTLNSRGHGVPVQSGGRSVKGPNGRLWFVGGVAGVVSVTCYILSIALPWPEGRFGTLAVLALASTWPLLSIVYVYSLYDYVAMERQGTANRLGFVFCRRCLYDATRHDRGTARHRCWRGRGGGRSRRRGSQCVAARPETDRSRTRRGMGLPDWRRASPVWHRHVTAERARSWLGRHVGAARHRPCCA